MKKYGFYLILAIFLSSCATPTGPFAVPMHGPFAIDKPYGGSAPYGEGIHPGVDYGISRGKPIIAISNGKVILIKEIGLDGGEVVVVHGKHFMSIYAHLSKIFVMEGQLLKRGQLLGLSGASNNYGKIGNQHLHFGLCIIGRGGRCADYSNSLDPQMFWLGGQPQCFDPKMDYSAYFQKDITLPIACGDYGKALIAESMGKD